MKTTESSRQNEQEIRSLLLKKMIGGLGYPRELIIVEKQLSLLPHLHHQKGLPTRRADLICFAKNVHPEHALFPLLLIECKDGPIGRDAEQQAIGYNHYLQAPFIALANQEGEKLIFPRQMPFLPSYEQLIQALCK